MLESLNVLACMVRPKLTPMVDLPVAVSTPKPHPCTVGAPLGVGVGVGVGLAVVEHSGIPNSCQYWSLPALGFQRLPHCARVSDWHWAAMEAIKFVYVVSVRLRIYDCEVPLLKVQVCETQLVDGEGVGVYDGEGVGEGHVDFTLNMLEYALAGMVLLFFHASTFICA